MTNDAFDVGLEIRKKVVGEKYVEAAMANADDFTRDFQELVTTYCWGAVWGRDALPHKVRSMLNIAMLAALPRPHELKTHIKGALRNGVSEDEIREILMQVAVYSGVPNGVEGFRVAREAIQEFNAADE
jgi:4-carboxymuconolactone decarboxylase